MDNCVVARIKAVFDEIFFILASLVINKTNLFVKAASGAVGDHKIYFFDFIQQKMAIHRNDMAEYLSVLKKTQRRAIRL